MTMDVELFQHALLMKLCPVELTTERGVQTMDSMTLDCLRSYELMQEISEPAFAPSWQLACLFSCCG